MGIDVYKLSKKIDNSKEFIEIRENFHKYPELSGNEVETTRVIKSFLENVGIEIIDIGLNTGVIGFLKVKESEDCIALRADIDALPITEKTDLPYKSFNEGVSHSCGHDIHITCMLLVAKTLTDYKGHLKENIMFIFQPAEENGSGAQSVIETGILQKFKPKYFLALHTWPYIKSGSIGVKQNYLTSSSDSFKLQIIGRGGHGGHPDDCIDPIYISSNIITSVQSIVSRLIAPSKSAVISIGKICGGTSGNVIPEKVFMEGTIRSSDNEARDFIIRKFIEMISNICKTYGAKYNIDFEESIPAVKNDFNLVQKIKKSSDEILGENHYKVIEEVSTGAEDFALYLNNTPGAMFRLGTANNQEKSRLGLHNAGNLFDSNSIFTGAKVICNLLLKNW